MDYPTGPSTTPIGPCYDFDEVARTRRAVLVSIAARTCDRVDAEDAVQDAFVVAWSKREQWGTGGNPVALLVAITRYRAMVQRGAAWQRRARSVLVDFEAGYGDAGYLDPRAYVDYDASDTINDPRRADLVAAALATLTPRQRQVVQLLWLDGRTRPEAAIELGLTEGGLNSLANYALKKMRKALNAPERPERRQVQQQPEAQPTEAALARQSRAVHLQGKGLSRAEIAKQMGVSPRMVNAYLAGARAAAVQQAS